jgi:hypothetical protein
MKIQLFFREKEKDPLLEDLSSLMYDFELLYNFCLVTNSKKYADYNFPQGFWYRKGRGISDEDKLRTSKIIKESPLSIELLIAATPAALGAVWLLIQAIEKVYNMELEHRKKALKIKKLKLEIQKLENQKLEKEAMKKDLEEVLKKPQNQRTFRFIYRRLETSTIKLEDFEFAIDDAEP